MTAARPRMVGATPPEHAYLLTSEALAFLAGLHRAFNPTRQRLLARRHAIQGMRDEGYLPQFRPETEYIRHSDWQIAPVPADLQRRRVEITGPASDVKMVINAFNSG